MIKFDEWYLPDHEAHLQKWMSDVNHRVDGRLTYQYGKYQEALRWCKSFRGAIDIGAHVGLWSWFMARDFERLSAFEPCAAHRACWLKNMDSLNNCDLHHCALGKISGRVTIATRTPDSSGDTGVVAENGDIRMETLDDLYVPSAGFTDPPIDFIKIDCEGYESNIIEGGKNMLQRHKPCVIVEQKGDMSQQYGLPKLEAVKKLQALGAVLRSEICGDYILSWD